MVSDVREVVLQEGRLVVGKGWVWVGVDRGGS